MTRSEKAGFAVLVAVGLGSTVAVAGDLAIPNTFVPGNVIRASEVNANFTAVETANDANVADIAAMGARVTALENPTLPRRTAIAVPTTSLGSLAANTWTSLGTIGVFNKTSATTTIEAVFNGRVQATVAGGTNNVAFQLRVDGQPGPTVTCGFTTCTVGTGQLWHTQATGQANYMSFEGYFTGLAAGSHTLQMWVFAQGNTASNIWMNSGGFFDYVIVREE